jgi:hypothetical protein
MGGRKYRLAPWIVLSNSIIGCYFGIATLITMILSFFLVVLLGTDPNFGWLNIIFVPLLISAVVTGSLMAIMPVGRFLFSYLSVSDQGLEYFYWPNYRAKCTWQDVELIGKWKSVWGIPHEVLFVNKLETMGSGWAITKNVRNALSLPELPKILPLTGISGWPNGALASELRHYLPHVFETQNKA